MCVSVGVYGEEVVWWAAGMCWLEFFGVESSFGVDFVTKMVA